MKSKKVKAKAKGKTTGRKKKAAVKKITQEQIQLDSLAYDAKHVLSLMTTLLVGYFTKVSSAIFKIGGEPLAYVHYLKAPLLNLFADFENQMMTPEKKK